MHGQTHIRFTCGRGRVCNGSLHARRVEKEWSKNCEMFLKHYTEESWYIPTPHPRPSSSSKHVKWNRWHRMPMKAGCLPRIFLNTRTHTSSTSATYRQFTLYGAPSAAAICAFSPPPPRQRRALKSSHPQYFSRVGRKQKCPSICLIAEIFEMCWSLRKCSPRKPKVSVHAVKCPTQQCHICITTFQHIKKS